MSRVNRAGAVVVRRKLDWINKQHLQRKLAGDEGGPASLVDLALPLLRETLAGPNASAASLTDDDGQPRWEDCAYVQRVLETVKVEPALRRPPYFLKTGCA